MRWWIVKHVREPLWAGEDGEVFSLKIHAFRVRSDADSVPKRMQVPADWQVVEVEITEK